IVNVQRRLLALGRLLRARAARFARLPAGNELEPMVDALVRFNYVPVDEWLKWLEKLIARAEGHPAYDALARRVNLLRNPSPVSGPDIRWLLREGGEREPRKVLEQFAKWTRRGELTCYRTGYDYKQGFSNISIPMAIIFGDMDPLASVESTRSVYRAARSE